MGAEGESSNDLPPIRASNARKLIVPFFAFVGFVASVVTVLDYVKPAEVSALEVEVNVYPFRTPHYVGEELQSGGQGRLLSSRLRNTACEGVDSDELSRAVRGDLVQIDRQDERETKLNCFDAISVEFAARWVGEFSEGDNTLLEYEIANIGRKSAEDIRIQGTSISNLQYQSGSSFVDVQKNATDEYYELPKLNPGERIRILAWSQKYFPNISYADWDDFPIVTFAGSEVHTELKKPVTDGWYNLFEFFHDASIVIIIVFAILFSIVVLLILYGLVGIILIVATGRSFSEVFGTAKQSSPPHEAHEDNGQPTKKTSER